MKKITFIISILLLTLTVVAQKSDFKTAVKDITIKAQTQTQAEFVVAAKDFISKFYPSGFDENDFVKKASELSEGFKPDCASCVGSYIGCSQTCWGTQCVWCGVIFNACWRSCGGGPAVAVSSRTK